MSGFCDGCGFDRDLEDGFCVACMAYEDTMRILRAQLRERDRRIARARKILEPHHWPQWGADAWEALAAPRKAKR